MDTTDTELAAIKVPVVSCKTALFCLDRVCGSDGMRVSDAAIAAVDSTEESVLPLDRLIAIAATSGVQLRAANFDWRGLLIATSTKGVLLFLRNGNVVAVLGTGREGIEEVTVSDPLYRSCREPRGGERQPVAHRAAERPHPGRGRVTKAGNLAQPLPKADSLKKPEN